MTVDIDHIEQSRDEPARRRLSRCVGLRLEPWVYDLVEAAAAADHRSVSGYVRRVLLDKLAEAR